MRADRLATTFGLALLLAAAPAHADWKRDYDRGLRAIEKQQWSDAEAAFRAAIAEEPTPDARKRFQGARTAIYAPQHYAGVAAWRQGACDRALQYWSNAASTAIIAAVSRLDAEQERGMLDCRARLASAGASPGAVSTPAPVAAAPGVSPASAGATSQGTTSSSATSTPSTAPAPKPAAPPPEPRTAATASPAKSPAAGTQSPSRPPASNTATPAVTAPATAAPASAAPAPAALVTAVDDYLAGRLDALLALDPTRFADGRSRAQALLLRAAAHHRRAELAGSDALDDARRDVRAARAANASLQPDAALFPPRFRSFWQQTK